VKKAAALLLLLLLSHRGNQLLAEAGYVNKG
jgi:hypothetical protein